LRFAPRRGFRKEFLLDLGRLFLVGCVLGVGARERMQVGKRQPAPWSAQAGEPRQTVGRVRERMRQREQVLHDLAVAELLDVKRA
jgi:hypothetical protein